MYQVFISGRYLRRRVTALLAVAAVAFGVKMLMIVLSIMDGYVEQLQEITRSSDSDIVITGRPGLSLCDAEALEERLLKLPQVRAASPFVQTLGPYRSGRFQPCVLRGLDPEKELGTTALSRFLLRPAELSAVIAAGGDSRAGQAFKDRADAAAKALLSAKGRAPLTAEESAGLFSLAYRERLFDEANPGLRGQFRAYAPGAVVVGLHLLTSRNLAVGQVTQLLTLDPEGQRTVSAQCIVTGAFKTGHHDVDSRAFLIHVERLATLLSPDAAAEGCRDGLRLALHDPERADELKSLVHEEVLRFVVEKGDPRVSIEVRTWKEFNQIYITAVKIEKWIMGFVVSLLDVFCGCVVLLMLVLIVLEKTRDAGVLLALGATPRAVFSIFLLTGSTITAAGTVCGLVGGWLFLGSINTIHDGIYGLTRLRLWDPEVYLMDRIPTAIRPGVVVLSVLPALLFGLCASLVPAIWAARKDPIQAIHHE